MNTAWIDVLHLIVPELILGFVACVLFLGATFDSNRHRWAGVALFGLIAAGLALWRGPVYVPGGDAVYASALVLDPLGFFTKAIALAAGVVFVLLSWNQVPDRLAAEYHACLLLIVAGLCLTGSANELVT